MTCSIDDFTNCFNKGKYKIVFMMGTLFPVLLVIISTINNSQLIQSIAGAYPAMLILITIPIINSHVDYESIIFNILITEAIVTILIVVLDLLHIFDINSMTSFRRFFYQMGMGFMGKSAAYSSYYRVFFKTSPLFIYLLDYVWRKRNRIFTLIVIIAIILSGTRANFLIGLIYVVWRLSFKTVKNQSLQIILLMTMIAIMVCTMGKMIELIWNMMNRVGSIESDAIRIGQFKGLIKELNNIPVLLFGAGLGTKFFDYGRMSLISGVELSYFDLLRQIGLLLFIPFIMFITYPLLNKISTETKIAHIGYLAIAFTNPLLYTSTAFLAYIYMYYLLYNRSSHK